MKHRTVIPLRPIIGQRFTRQIQKCIRTRSSRSSNVEPDAERSNQPISEFKKLSSSRRVEIRPRNGHQWNTTRFDQTLLSSPLYTLRAHSSKLLTPRIASALSSRAIPCNMCSFFFRSQYAYYGCSSRLLCFSSKIVNFRAFVKSI